MKGGDTPKKAKQRDKEKASAVKELASDIIKEVNEEEDILSEDVTYVEEGNETPKSLKGIPSQPVVEEVKIEPVNLTQGTTKPTAFIIQKNHHEIHSILGNLFGFNGGDYFVINENTFSSQKHGMRRRHKCISVEDKNGFRYVIWFDLSNIGLF